MSDREPKSRRRLRRLAAGGAAFCACWLTGAFLLDFHGHRVSADPPPDSADAIVVLGALVNPDGSASTVLARRARKGAALYHAGVAPLVIATGGQGRGEPRAEAAAIADVLVAEGVPRDAILLEDESHSTRNNAAFAAQVSSDRNLRHVVIVSDAFHLLRARRIFARHFAQVTPVAVTASLPVRARGSLREVVALGHNLLAGHL